MDSNFSSLKTTSADMKLILSEPTVKVLPIESNVVYHETSIGCESIDPFTTYIKIPETPNLIDSDTIMDISKNHTTYNFDV